MYEARQIAAKFLDRSPSLTPIQLIKLTYITHGWHLAIVDQKLL